MPMRVSTEVSQRYSNGFKLYMHRSALEIEILRSSSVIGLRFGVNQNLEQLRRSLLETNLKLGGNIVNTRKRQVIGHGAVARHIDFASDALDLYIVHIHYFRKFIHNGLELLLQHRVP